MPPPEELRPSTPPSTNEVDDLDRSLLDSSPLEGTEVRQANVVVNRIVRESNITSPAKRYLERSGSALERVVSENTLLRKENTDFRELSRVRKERKKGKRVAIKGRFVFNTAEILNIVAEAEAESSRKKMKKGRGKRVKTPENEEEEEQTSEDELLGT